MLWKMEIPVFERFSFQIWHEIDWSINNSDPRALWHILTIVLNVYSSCGQPSCETNDFSQCNFCPSYHFKSKTGKNNHMSVFHRCQRARPNPKNFICQTIHSSLSNLNCHKKEKKHTYRDQGEKRKKMNQNLTKSKKNKTKPRTMNNQWHAQS